MSPGEQADHDKLLDMIGRLRADRERIAAELQEDAEPEPPGLPPLRTAAWLACECSRLRAERLMRCGAAMRP